MGDARRTGGGTAELTAAELAAAELAAAELAAELRAGYDAAAGEWDAGPGPMYARLAESLMAAAPVPLAGALVLDLGAGTGAAGRAALAAGARHVVGADLSEAMLHGGGDGTHRVAANAVALPFRDHSFDLVVAAFCLNHLDSLGAGLAEARRVGAALAASMFAPGWTHPAKDAVDGVARSFGYQPPGWHTALEPGSRASDPGALAEQAAAAGFACVRTSVTDVPTGLATSAELVSWRLGMAHFAPFMRSLDAPGRAALRLAAEQAVAVVTGVGPAVPLIVSMLVLTAS